MSDINTLRTALFATLDALRDPKNPMDIERARAINDTAQTIINASKLEIDFAKVTGQESGSGFIPTAMPGIKNGTLTQLPTPQGVAGQLVAANIRTHKA